MIQNTAQGADFQVGAGERRAAWKCLASLRARQFFFEAKRVSLPAQRDERGGPDL